MKFCRGPGPLLLINQALSICTKSTAALILSDRSAPAVADRNTRSPRSAPVHPPLPALRSLFFFDNFLTAQISQSVEIVRIEATLASHAVLLDVHIHQADIL